MLRCQRGAETLAHPPAILPPHQPRHLSLKPLLVGSVRRLPRAAVLQTPRPFLPISLPQALRLPIAQPQHHRRVHHPQLLTAHARHHLDPSQLPPAHCTSPQSDLLSEATLGDISIEAKRGHYHGGRKGIREQEPAWDKR